MLAQKDLILSKINLGNHMIQELIDSKIKLVNSFFSTENSGIDFRIQSLNTQIKALRKKASDVMDKYQEYVNPDQYDAPKKEGTDHYIELMNEVVPDAEFKENQRVYAEMQHNLDKIYNAIQNKKDALDDLLVKKIQLEREQEIINNALIQSIFPIGLPNQQYIH